MKSISSIIILLFILSRAYGQSNEVNDLIDKGIKLNDNGDFVGAVEQYTQALKIDSTSPRANYEISSTYFALGVYDKSIEYVDRVIAAKSNYVDQAYILKGSALDLMGKSAEAIKVYAGAIKKYPDNHLLHYNLAYTYFNLKEYKKAEEALQKALKIKSSHASSHLLMGYVMSDQGYRVKSLLALYNFLLIEPDGTRAKSSYELLDSELRKGVKKQNDSSIAITLSNNTEPDEFRSAELMLSFLEAAKSTEKNKGKTECEMFVEHTTSFFSLLGELKKTNKGFWWNYYVDFFYSMTNQNHVEAFSYYIIQSRTEKEINSWLKNNEEKVEGLLKWHSDYNRKF